MNLSLYAGVLRRFRLLVAGGVLLALSLAVLSAVRVSRDGIEYRSQELWQDQGTLLLTQDGFPEGRALFPPAVEPQPGETPKLYPYAGIGRFTSLVDFYAQLATSDPVKRIMLSQGPIRGTVLGVPVQPATAGGSSPLISILGRAQSSEEATTMVERGTRALRAYVSKQQQQAGIPANQRVHLRVLKRTDKPVVLEGRKNTLPIVVLLAVLSATLGLAFVLENARPAIRPLLPVADEQLTEARRSA